MPESSEICCCWCWWWLLWWWWWWWWFDLTPPITDAALVMAAIWAILLIALVPLFTDCWRFMIAVWLCGCCCCCCWRPFESVMIKSRAFNDARLFAWPTTQNDDDDDADELVDDSSAIRAPVATPPPAIMFMLCTRLRIVLFSNLKLGLRCDTLDAE